MKALKDRIQNEGTAIGTEIIKVDSFLNHQLDISLLDMIGQEFAESFAGCGATKILTVEASGIAIACSTSRRMNNLPVVFAKKAAPSTLTEDFYSAKAKSFTKGTESNLIVSHKYISSDDKILILDDFLAAGEAARALIEIVKAAGAEIVGYGAAIEKTFQGGREYLDCLGINVVSLARIKRIENGTVYFE